MKSMIMLAEREMKLHKVQRLFTSIVEELFIEPVLLARFMVWLDYKLAEYKYTGNMQMALFADVGTNDFGLPSWLKALTSINETLECEYDHGVLFMTDTMEDVNQMENIGIERNNTNVRHTGISEINTCLNHAGKDIHSSRPELIGVENSNLTQMDSALILTDTERMKGKQIIRVTDTTPISTGRNNNNSQLLRLELEKDATHVHREMTRSNKETTGRIPYSTSIPGEITLKNIKARPGGIAMENNKTKPENVATTTRKAAPGGKATTTRKAMPGGTATAARTAAPSDIATTTSKATPGDIATTSKTTSVVIAMANSKAISEDKAATTGKATPGIMVMPTHNATPEDIIMATSGDIATATRKATTGVMAPTTHKETPSDISIRVCKAASGSIATSTRKAPPMATAIMKNKAILMGREHRNHNAGPSVKAKGKTTLVNKETFSNTTLMSTDLMNIVSVDDGNAQLSIAVTRSKDVNRKLLNDTIRTDATRVVETDNPIREAIIVDTQTSDQHKLVQNSDSGIFDVLCDQTPSTNLTIRGKKRSIIQSSGKKRKLKSKYRFRKFLRGPDGTYKLAAINVQREEKDASCHTSNGAVRNTSKSPQSRGQVQQWKGLSVDNLENPILEDTVNEEQEKLYAPKSWYKVHSETPGLACDTCSYEDVQDFHDLFRNYNLTSPCFLSQPFTAETKLQNMQEKHINICDNDLYTNSSESETTLSLCDDTSPCKVKIANVFSLRPDPCPPSNSPNPAQMSTDIVSISEQTVLTDPTPANDTISNQISKPVCASNPSNPTNITYLPIKSNTATKYKARELVSSAQDKADTCMTSNSVTSYSLCQIFDHIREVPLYKPSRCIVPIYPVCGSSSMTTLTSSVTDTTIQSGSSCGKYNSNLVKDIHRQASDYQASSSATVSKAIQKVLLKATTTTTCTKDSVTTTGSNSFLTSTHSQQNTKDLVPKQTFIGRTVQPIGLARRGKNVSQKRNCVGTLKTTSDTNSDIAHIPGQLTSIPSTVVPCYVSMGNRIMHIASECGIRKPTVPTKDFMRRVALGHVPRPIAPKPVLTSDTCTCQNMTNQRSHNTTPSRSVGLTDLGALRQVMENEKTVKRCANALPLDLLVSEQNSEQMEYPRGRKHSKESYFLQSND